MIQRYLIATILFSVILRANAFKYKDAQDWGKTYSKCNGRNQSPIILETNDEMGFPPIDQKMKFTNFKKLPTNVTIKNTGHTVEVRAHWPGKAPTISGGPLHKNYVFEKITFHWAQKAWDVGEAKEDHMALAHVPNPLDMEMHIFFYKTDLKSFKNAQKQKGGLAVFNIPLKIAEDNPEHFFDILEKNVHKVQSPKSPAVEIPSFRLTSILIPVPNDPNFDSSFNFYEGSLDYPPCFESVTWFVNDFAVIINKNLVNEFRKIKLAEGDVSNVRPTQPRNNRQPQSVLAHSGKDE